MRLIFLSLMPAVMVLQTMSSLADDEIPVTGDQSPNAVIETVDQTDGIPASLAIRRAAAHDHLKQLNGEQRYDEAAAVAMQILRLTQEEFGDAAQQVIDPLIELADTQRQSGEPAAAERNLSSAILLIEKYDGPLSIKLIGPMTMLGEIYNKSGQHNQAIQSFERALRLSHVNQGFLNFDQFRIMDGLTESHVSLEDLEEATFYQESQLEIQQRKLGIDNPETAQSYYKLARWYSRTYRYDDSILTYQRADNLVRTTLGKDSPERTDALLGLALEYQQIGNGAAASSVLRKALQLIEESPDNNPLRRASVLVALGDNLTREGKFTTARSQYITAWQALSDDDIGAERREFYFDRRVRLEGSLFPRYARRARGRSDDELRTGTILIDYSIDTKGRVREVSVIESDPQGLMDRSFLSTYQNSLFRPHFVEGTAESRDGLLAKHEFFYISDKTAAADGPEDEAEDDSDDQSKPSRGKLSYPDKN